MANYYPIKCQYCLKAHTNETVRFNLNDAITLTDRAAKKPVQSQGAANTGGSYIEKDGASWDSGPAGQANDNDVFIEGGSNWDTDVADSQQGFTTGHTTSQTLPDEGYFTLSELKEVFGANNVKPEYKTVIALPALTGDEYLGELLVGVTYTYTERDRVYEKTVRHRYCDCGEGSKLNASSGSIPSYVILLMGSSDSGKTVYLASLYHALSRNSKYSFPPSQDPDRAIANLWLSVLSEGMDDLDIERISEDLFDVGKLPFTTFALTNEPLTMEVTIKFNRTGLINKALLFLRDVPGEYFSNRDRQQELMRITNQFPRFDGFMIMFDPTAFEEAVFPVDDVEKDRNKRRQVNLFRQVIMRNIAPTMINNMINQPTAAIITKGDMFFDRNVMSALKNKGISYAMPLLVVSQKESFDMPYFREVDEGAKKILEMLSRNVSEMMGAHFGNAFFTMVSSLSRNPIDMYIDEQGRRRVSAPAAISPWHVTDPMLRLLMKLRIVPPLDETNARPLTGETHDQRQARIFRNRSIINEWGARYCSGGSNVNLV